MALVRLRHCPRNSSTRHLCPRMQHTHAHTHRQPHTAAGGTTHPCTPAYSRRQLHTATHDHMPCRRTGAHTHRHAAVRMRAEHIGAHAHTPHTHTCSQVCTHTGTPVRRCASTQACRRAGVWGALTGNAQRTTKRRRESRRVASLMQALRGAQLAMEAAQMAAACVEDAASTVRAQRVASAAAKDIEAHPVADQPPAAADADEVLG